MKYLAYDDFTQSVLAEGSLMEVIPALAEDEQTGLAVLGDNGTLREPTAEEDAAALLVLRAYAESRGIAPREDTAQPMVSVEEYLRLIRFVKECKAPDSGSPWRRH